MKWIKKKILDFYTNEKELDITFFKLLGTGGILVSLVGAMQAIITIQDYQSAIINAVAMLASLALIWFVHATKRYTLGYLITSVTIFMGLFAWLFFEGGGMNGANPYFFTFGIVFTLMMYRGWLLIVMTGLQIAFYSAVCYISYIHPELVEAYDSPRSQFIDQLSGILISSFGLGVIFMMYIWEYRKQQKVASESSQAKSELLANISHEIRTPINMLLGMNEMILRECENTQIKEYAKNVENAGQHLLFMVNQFLDLSRIDMGKENLFYADFNLLEMMYGLGAFFENEADKKGLEFVLDLDKKTPAYVHGDMQKLSQILSNLLSNAVKYTKAGTIVFSIQPIQEMEDSTVIHFEVSDTGSGISEEDQEKIFESFERADIIRNRSIEGTGLGLAISSKLAEMMGSEIKVKSEYEIGSVFWFDLELKLGDAQEIALNEERSFIAPEVRILVVDDNSMNLTVVKSLLKRTLVMVDFAESARECYEKYGQKEYHAVLMDYMMPEIDGIEAMKHLRMLDDAKGKHTPIIVLTADATAQKREMFLKEGFDDYLLKPIDSALLEKALANQLPQELVTIVDNKVSMKLTDSQTRHLTELLKSYDISLELALKHLSNDVEQLARIGDFFVQNSEEGMNRLRRFIESDDYEAAALLVHSIKGNAGNVGGEELYYSARRLERRIRDRDKEYVEAALPFFLMKWRRTELGIEQFLNEFQQILPELNGNGERKQEVLDEASLWNLLKEAIRMGNQSPALTYLDELEIMVGKTEQLEEIRRAVQEIEFDKAGRLLKR